MADRLDFELCHGAFVRFDLLAAPVKHVPLNGPNGVKRHTYPSVAVERVRHNDPEAMPRFVEPRDKQVRDLRYSQWIFEQVMTEGRGLEIASVPEILDSRPSQHLMKLNGKVESIILPTVHAQFDAVVRDPDAAMAFLRQGLKKRKDLGMGGIFPLQVIQEILS